MSTYKDKYIKYKKKYFSLKYGGSTISKVGNTVENVVSTLSSRDDEKVQNISAINEIPKVKQTKLEEDYENIKKYILSSLRYKHGFISTTNIEKYMKKLLSYIEKGKYSHKRSKVNLTEELKKKIYDFVFEEATKVDVRRQKKFEEDFNFIKEYIRTRRRPISAKNIDNYMFQLEFDFMKGNDGPEIIKRIFFSDKLRAEVKKFVIEEIKRGNKKKISLLDY